MDVDRFYDSDYDSSIYCIDHQRKILIPNILRSGNVSKMAKYSVEQFQNDLAQLGGMIEGFYAGGQAGGKQRKKSASKKSKKPKKTKRTKSSGKKKTQRGGAKRFYKVSDVNGRPYPYYRRYTGAEPKDAALKAFHFICKKLNMDKSCNITFTLKETSRGSDKRTYGPYRGRYEKLDKPRLVKIGNKKITTVTHKRIVELVRGK